MPNHRLVVKLPTGVLSGLGGPWSVVVAVLIALVLAQFSFFLTTIYLHRALAHRALTLSPRTIAACRVLIWVATGTRPRQWVAVHRKHHAFTDKEGDPHSPFLFGYATVQFNNVGLYHKMTRDPVAVARYARDLPQDRWDAWFFDHGWLGLALGIAALIALMGWELGLIAGAVYTATYLLGGEASPFGRLDVDVENGDFGALGGKRLRRRPTQT